MKALHGDLGESYKIGVSVWKTMLGRIPNTLKLTGATLLLTVLLAVPLGVLSAVYQNRFVDYLLRFNLLFRSVHAQLLGGLPADVPLRHQA
ncbi:MAG: hypothetical protein IKD63_04865, partial [Oscillospiraceae bacterium]|nr:hypothetical protein [Oscillospiraceae bacterium]